MAKKTWNDLTSRQKASIVASIAVQLGLLGAALIDIRHRSQEQIRGKKWVWTVASFINYVGPISYCLFGRKR